MRSPCEASGSAATRCWAGRRGLAPTRRRGGHRGRWHVPIGFARHVLDTLVAYVTSAQGEVPLSDDPVIRDRVASLHSEVEAAERLAKRAIWMQENGQDNMVFAAMAKVYATELLQRSALAATDIAGVEGTLYRPLFGPASSSSAGDGRFAWEYLERVHGTIGGGPTR